MASRKFNFSLSDEKRDVIELAAERLGMDKTEIIRIGAYQFALLILSGAIEESFCELLKKDNI